MSRKRRLPLAVEWSQRVLADLVGAGSWVVDATAGNGHDALFLAQQVGPLGRVFAFDVQPEALDATRQLLADNGVEDGVCRLFLESHARMAEVLPLEVHGRLDAVMFNLGFLPGANKVHTTTVDGTIAALEAAAGMLAVGGVLSVVAYPGHDPGLIEAEAVARWMLALDSGRFEVQRVCAVNRVHPAPVLWLAMRCDVRG